jgi:cytochrome o ubiquinol oxidase operon protein cyoD
MNKVVVSHHDSAHGSVMSYSVGFGLSLALTLVAYISVTQDIASGWALIFILTGLALVQLLVQLLFFLHLGRESKPRWNFQVMLFAAGVVLIVVFGSLWIMKNLQYNHSKSLTPQEIIKDEGLKPSNY